MLQRWPTAKALGLVSRDELAAWARAQRSGYGERFADRVQAALAAEQFRAPAHLVRAKVDTIRLAAAQLLLLGVQRRAWQRRMSELLLGATRTPTSGDDHEQEHKPEQAFPALSALADARKPTAARPAQPLTGLDEQPGVGRFS
jgi:hypothetical protein